MLTITGLEPSFNTTGLLVGEPIVHGEVKEHGADRKKFTADEEEKAGASDAEEPA